MSGRSWFDNLSSIVLALVLAALVWLVATERDMPMRTIPRFPLEGDGLEVAIVDPPPGRAAYDVRPRDVRIVLRGIEDHLANVSADDFDVTLDLSAAKPGQQLFSGPVRVRCDACVRQGIRVTSVEPPRVTVRLGPALSQTRAVVVTPAGEVAPGYRVTVRSSDPSQVIVSGPALRVKEVSQVIAPVDGLADVHEDRRFEEVEVVPVDRDGQRVPDVQVQPAKVDAMLGIGRRGVEVAVDPVVKGVEQLADGYYLTGISVTPPFVQLEGPSDQLQAIEAEGALATSPVNIRGASADVSELALLLLPEGVTATNAPDGVTVTVQVSALPGTVSFEVPVVARRVPDGLEATVTPERVRVLLSGPRPEIEGLTADEITAYVDLSGRGPGKHRLPPRIETPPGVTATSSTPAVVEVALSGGPRGGASPTATTGR